MKKTVTVKAGTAKAGKRSGPPKLTEPNESKAQRREAGRQQFYSPDVPKHDISFDSQRRQVVWPCSKAPDELRQRGSCQQRQVEAISHVEVAA